MFFFFTLHDLIHVLASISIYVLITSKFLSRLPLGFTDQCSFILLEFIKSILYSTYPKCNFQFSPRYFSSVYLSTTFHLVNLETIIIVHRPKSTGNKTVTQVRFISLISARGNKLQRNCGLSQ